MKVAFVLDNFPKLSETFILNQIKGLIDQGHEVRILAANKPKEDKEHEVVEEYNLIEKTTYINPPQTYKEAIIQTPRNFLKLWKREGKLLELLKTLKKGKKAPRKLAGLETFSSMEDFDIIHYHFGTTAKDFIELSKISDAKILATFYGNDVSGRVHPDDYDLYEDIWVELDRAIAITQHIRSKMILLGCSEEKSTVLNLGVNSEKFEKSIPEFKSADALEIASICRHVEKKGLKYAIDAVSRLNDQGVNLHYKIAGDGPLKEDLEQRVNDKGLEDKVEFCGWVDQNEVADILDNSHIFLQPSITAQSGDMEGQALVLQEAQAKGTPVVSTYHNGIPEGVKESETAFLAPERDSEAIYKCIRKFIQKPALVREMGRAARKNIENSFDYREKTLKQIDIYSETPNS